jgi:hypothetical protein
MDADLNAFIGGAITMASFAIGLFFLKYWRRTRDRFFIFFSCAFWIFAVERILLCFVGANEFSPKIYLIRMVGFLLIICAILDKNRTPQI